MALLVPFFPAPKKSYENSGRGGVGGSKDMIFKATYKVNQNFLKGQGEDQTK